MYRQLYFLYAWIEPGDPTLATPPMWRYRIENAQTHEQHAFRELRALVEFLERAQATIQPHPTSGASQGV